MAYIDQTKKAKIAAALRDVVPKDWKWTLAVRHHSTVVLTIWEAPVDLVTEWARVVNSQFARDTPVAVRGHVDVNPYGLERQFEGRLLDVFHRIVAALNTDNYDRSDPMTDYFDVGHYVDVRIGRWDKPFTCTGEASSPNWVTGEVARWLR